MHFIFANKDNMFHVWKVISPIASIKSKDTDIDRIYNNELTNWDMEWCWQPRTIVKLNIESNKNILKLYKEEKIPKSISNFYYDYTYWESIHQLKEHLIILKLYPKSHLNFESISFISEDLEKSSLTFITANRCSLKFCIGEDSFIGESSQFKGSFYESLDFTNNGFNSSATMRVQHFSASDLKIKISNEDLNNDSKQAQNTSVSNTDEIYLRKCF